MKDNVVGNLYLNMDSLTGIGKLLYSDSGVKCSENDVLLLMDGASSGKSFFGFSGIVGSTLCKIEHDNKINSSILYLLLKFNEEHIKSNLTGSAVPHTDKNLVCSLLYPNVSEKEIEDVGTLLNLIVVYKKRIANLSRTKGLLINKYF